MHCAVCAEPGPMTPAEHVAEDWFSVDPDGIEGPLPPVMLCCDHVGDLQAVHAALYGANE
jgi:hypothetical protein